MAQPLHIAGLLRDRTIFYTLSPEAFPFDQGVWGFSFQAIIIKTKQQNPGRIYQGLLKIRSNLSKTTTGEGFTSNVLDVYQFQLETNEPRVRNLVPEWRERIFFLVNNPERIICFTFDINDVVSIDGDVNELFQGMYVELVVLFQKLLE